MPYESTTTTIEDGTKFDGAIESERPVRIGGEMKGKLEAPEVTVTKSGSVRGEVQVGRISSEGEIGGRIEADEVHLAGRVLDGTVIEADAIRVDIGANDATRATFESCELRIGSDVDDGERREDGEPVGATVPVDQRDAQAEPEPEEEPIA